MRMKVQMPSELGTPGPGGQRVPSANRRAGCRELTGA